MVPVLSVDSVSCCIYLCSCRVSDGDVAFYPGNLFKTPDIITAGCMLIQRVCSPHSLGVVAHTARFSGCRGRKWKTSRPNRGVQTTSELSAPFFLPFHREGRGDVVHESSWLTFLTTNFQSDEPTVVWAACLEMIAAVFFKLFPSSMGLNPRNPWTSAESVDAAPGSGNRRGRGLICGDMATDWGILQHSWSMARLSVAPGYRYTAVPDGAIN